MKNFNIQQLHTLNTILFVLTVITSIASMYLSNDLATKGVNLSHLEDRVFALESENQYLSSEYYQAIALENVSAKALENGLTKANVDFYSAPSFASR